jgi:hypothetical protein
MVVQALTNQVKGKCEETAAHMGESLNTFDILNRHLETIDQLHLTYSLKRKPSYYSNYPPLLTTASNSLLPPVLIFGNAMFTVIALLPLSQAPPPQITQQPTSTGVSSLPRPL